MKPVFKDIHKPVKGNLSHYLTKLGTVMTSEKADVIKCEAWESIAI
jgi:hypothetical protein